MAKIKLILVDDELTGRNTIKNYLKNDADYEIVADFSDGRFALDWLRKNEADILLCDMQMPEITGVELMRIVHTIDESMPVIVISGFDNFDYVRGSLINGAANYLLKHELTEKKIREVLNQVREKYRIVPKEKGLCRRKGFCIRDIKEYSAENILNMVETGRIEFNCTNIIPLVLGPDYRLNDHIIPREYKQSIMSAVMDILAQIAGQAIPYLIYITPDYHLVVLLSFPDIRSNLYMINAIKNLVNKLLRQVIRMLDITCTVVIGDVQMKLDKAICESLEMESGLKDKLYLGGNRTTFHSLNSKPEYRNEELPIQIWKQIEYEVMDNVVGMTDTVKHIFDYMEDRRFSKERVIDSTVKIAKLLVTEDSERFRRLEEQVVEFEIFEEFRGKILNLCHERKLQRNADIKGYSTLINQVMEYIENHYQTDLSLENCAHELGVSYTYLSRSFKQETGLRFVEYLNQCRVKKAKSLLIRKALPMKEILEMVGFRNYNYFFKVFKESEGVTPSEFSAKY